MSQRDAGEMAAVTLIYDHRVSERTVGSLGY